MVSLQFIVEDPRGSLCHVCLYNYPGIVGATLKHIDALFPVGTILALQEPLLKQADVGEGILLRVDCPSHVHALEADDALIRGVVWRTGVSVSGAIPVPNTEDKWKNLGNSHFKAGFYLPAAVAYSRGLERHPTSDTLLLNRSLAYLRLRYFGAALADTEALSSRDIGPALRRKALFRAAQARYGMGVYEEALAGFRNVAAAFPEEKEECAKWARQCEARQREQTRGLYDWIGLFKACQVPGFRPDVAEYVGPVKVQSMQHRGGGRGIVATKDIKSGELLVLPALTHCQRCSMLTLVIL